MADQQYKEDELKISTGKKSQAGSINLKKMRGRFSNPGYVKAASSGRPEAVVKVIGYRQGYGVKKALDYISRIDTDKKENVDCENHLSGTINGEKDILKTYDSWKKDFVPAKSGSKLKKRDAVHIMLSGDCKTTPENNKKVLNAARETINQELGSKGYDFVAALHNDSGNPHVHFVIKCKSRFREQGKLRINKPELFAIRTKFAANLREMGLDHVATYRKDRPELMERVTNGIDRLKKNETQFQRAMRRAAPSRDAFLYRKQALQNIVRLQDQIKKETIPASKKRRELLSAVRSVKRSLVKKRPDIEKEIAATLSKYGKDFERFNKTLASDRSQEKKEKANREKTIAKTGKELKQNIALARENIKESDAPELVKKDSLLVLDKYETDMALALKKGPLEYENREFKKNFDSLNGTAKKAIYLNEQIPESAVERLQQKRQLEKLSQEIEKQINQTRQIINKSKISPDKKQTALTDLRKFEKTVSRQLNRQLERGRAGDRKKK